MFGQVALLRLTPTLLTNTSQFMSLKTDGLAIFKQF